MTRSATVTRETAETAVEISLTLDGDGESTTETGIGFFDHMLDSFAKHGLFDLEVACDGDLHIDDHHTVEDVAIALGEAFDEAVGSVVVDVSGRPLFRFNGGFSQDRVGDFSSTMADHFCRSLATNAGLTLHARIEGENAHHEIEALFKALARALDDATRPDERREGTPSTKGAL